MTNEPPLHVQPLLHSIIVLHGWCAERDNPPAGVVETLEAADRIAREADLNEEHTNILRTIAHANAKFADVQHKVFASLDNPAGNALECPAWSDLVDQRTAALEKVHGTPQEQELLDTWKLPLATWELRILATVEDE